MAAPTRASDPETAGTAGHPAPQERLPVEGVLPRGLDGCLLHAFPHPADVGRLTGRSVLSGIRLEAGGARRCRHPAVPRRGVPLAPLPALAPPVWSAEAVTPASGTPGHVTMARPVRDPATGEWHTVAVHPGLGHAEHLIAGPDGTVRDARPFALGGAPLMSAVALTERHVVVFDLPVVHSPAAALVGVRPPYAWRRGRPARVGLLPRRGTAEPQWLPIEPCHVFGTVNAYEEDGRVVLDAVWRSRAFDTVPGGPPHVRRWTLDPAAGTARERPLVAGWGTALVDGRVYGRRHHHVFGVRDRAAGSALLHRDLLSGGTQAYEAGAGRRLGPPVFVPRLSSDGTDGPGGRPGAEGDGWIVVLAHDAAHRSAELLVFDALGLACGPCAAVRLSGGEPVAHRAAWLPAAGEAGYGERLP